MRIGFNAWFLGQQGTGSGQYAQHLLRALVKLEPGFEYQLFARTGHRASATWNVHELSTPFARRLDNLDKLWFEQVSFPRACRQARVDLCHVPYFASPLFPSVPTVVTIHDLIPLLLPAYRGSLRVRAYMRLVAAAAQRAPQIITDSIASKRDIVQHLKVPAERVHAIYLAADPACRPIRDGASLSAVRAKYGLPEAYLLYLGGFDQRKNLPMLLRAYREVLQAMGHEIPALVIAGRLPGVDTPFSLDPKRIASKLGIEQHVRFIGWVAEEDKPALYSAARFFVFLSVYEGFGLEPLEAMSCGTPVLASHYSSLPEIVGDGGSLVDATSLEEVVGAMLYWLQDDDSIAGLRQAALLQAARFDWGKTARETLQVYRAACGASSGASPPSG